MNSTYFKDVSSEDLRKAGLPFVICTGDDSVGDVEDGRVVFKPATVGEIVYALNAVRDEP